MSVRIRLSRHGAKKHPFYRIVVADSNFARDGRYIEQLGTYDPAPKEVKVEVKRDKLEKWLARGAKPTETVAHMLKRAGISTRRTAAPTEPSA
jgi:small subunit ribosomal protein S16